MWRIFFTPILMNPLSLDFFRRVEKFPGARYVIPMLIIGGWTLLAGWDFLDTDLLILAMVYLLLNVMIAVRYGPGPSMVSTVFSILAFDYFFVPPHFKFAVVDAGYWMTFVVMFIVTILTSRLAIRSRRSGEEALKAEMEAERERLMSSLLSSFSHDLKTPLTSIAGATSILLQQWHKVSLQDRGRLLQTINDESVRLHHLIEKILQITKIESGAINVRKEIHSLEEIIGSVLHRLDPFLQGRKVTTEVPFTLSAPMDALLIELVLINLLENAIRHTPEGSPIDIRAFQNGEEIGVEILDRGPGISKADQQRVFEKFYRSGKKDAWGSGLGLAVCEGVLRIHQGQIGVRDRKGGGSVFYFALPLR